MTARAVNIVKRHVRALAWCSVASVAAACLNAFLVGTALNLAYHGARAQALLITLRRKQLISCQPQGPRSRTSSFPQYITGLSETFSPTVPSRDNQNSTEGGRDPNFSRSSRVRHPRLGRCSRNPHSRQWPRRPPNRAISRRAQDKLFKPFLLHHASRPAEGTALASPSISYDIVINHGAAHRGRSLSSARVTLSSPSDPLPPQAVRNKTILAVCSSSFKL